MPANVTHMLIAHKAIQTLKAKGIDAMGQRTNLHLIPEDLGQRQLVEVLHSNEVWDPAAPTVIVAEGLLMYLPPEAVRALFRQCAAITGVGSRMAFSYVGTRTDSRPDAGPWTGLVLWLLKVGGEPWLWSLRPEELAPFLEENGWRNAPDSIASNGRYGVEFFGVALR